MAVHDVIVLGLGGMGSAAAYHLARRGARVLGLEQFGAAHDQGSSHGQTRVIVQAFYDPDYVPLLFRAYALWHTLEREAGVKLLTKTGALRIGAPNSYIVAGAVLSARTHRIPHEILAPDQIRKRYPMLQPQPDQVALLEYEAGMLPPERCVATHLERARHRGADLHFHEKVESWNATPAGVSVRTTESTYEGDRLVITAGPWIGQVLEDLSLPLQVTRVVVYWFEPRAHREEFKKLPIYIWEDQGTYAYGFPYVDGQGLKCGFHYTHEEVTTPETVRSEVGEDEKKRMHAHLAKLMPDGAGEILSVSTCVYTNTPDHHFIIDRHPAHENVIFASACSGHGFKYASVVGEVLADLALLGATAQPISIFSLRRFRSTVP